jgi:hypothetical protein
MTAKLFVTPTNAKTSAGGLVTFRASGGTGTGYTWSITDNQSGGSIVAGTGVYTAGTRLGLEDTIQVTDSGGATASQVVRIIDGPTLLSIRTTAQQRSDMVNSTFITDAEWNGYINASAKELYGILVQKYGDDYFASLPPYTFVTDGTSDFYPLPSDFFKLLGVDLQYNNSPNGFVTLKPYMMPERNNYGVPNMQTVYGRLTNLRYRIMGNRCCFIPRAAPAQTIRLFYVPRVTELVLDTDVLDGVSGWEEYVIADVCIKVLQKEESDTAVFERAKAGLLARIESESANRDAANPIRISDTAYQEIGWGIGSNWPGDGWGY